VSRPFLSKAVIRQGDCLRLLAGGRITTGLPAKVALTFFDPPFNQNKRYRHCPDDLPEAEYWRWVKQVCRRVEEISAPGAALYFMQREKNTEPVLAALRETGWTLQNLIIWQKRTSAVPGRYRYGKQYQIIAFATKGKRPRVFHRLRIDPPLLPEYKLPRPNGLYLTDCWSDIRELTAGYFAGEEALRTPQGERCHEQQSPVALLVRILLSSSNPGDLVLDPCAGSGTTLIAARQLGRPALGLELDPAHVAGIKLRLARLRPADAIASLKAYYRFTPLLKEIWR
jgi:site-specific DNA-methyltransferase (adenine-specific)